MSSSRPIGIFDSGIGGLTVASELVNRLPGEDIIYLADSINCPYGPREADEILCFVRRIIEYLIDTHNVKVIIAACNTAQSVMFYNYHDYGIPILGPISAGVEEANRITAVNKIGLLATEGTIRSGVYQSILQDKYGREVRPVAAPGLVTLAEEGEFNSPDAKRAIDSYMESFAKLKVDTVILGCTHFEYFRSVFEERYPELNFVIPGVGMAEAVEGYLSREMLQNEKQEAGRHTYLTTARAGISRSFLAQMEGLLDLGNLGFQQVNLTRCGKRRNLGSRH